MIQDRQSENITISKENESVIYKMLEYEVLTDNKYVQRRKIDGKINKILYSDDILEVTILPTDACNFKCVYCYQGPPCKRRARNKFIELRFQSTHKQ